jgi:hypothetical protein
MIARAPSLQKRARRPGTSLWSAASATASSTNCQQECTHAVAATAGRAAGALGEDSPYNAAGEAHMAYAGRGTPRHTDKVLSR